MKNPPCNKSYSNGICEGTMVIIDGSAYAIRLKCSVCGRIIKLDMSLKEYFRLSRGGK